MTLNFLDISLQVKYSATLSPFVKLIITSVAYNATTFIILRMDIKMIKDNLDAVAKTFGDKKIDTNSILLLSIAHALVLLVEKDGNNGKSKLLEK